MGTDRLVEELRGERDALFRVLDAVAPESMTTPGLVGEWSARELIAHLGYWAGHAVEAIHAVETGHAGEFGADQPSVDDVNATVARIARQASLATVRKREAASVDAFDERLRGMDASLLATRLPHHGLALEEAIREDGASHYREHADELRRVLGERASG
ncbi:MAG: maleylpyruvate isomerase N-terminal domain-containing protein [Chloroflexi bacterium]|nr:maleylpyruvate isomerase N-terminal domain-containing protein [Chloroflexota bacterium]